MPTQQFLSPGVPLFKTVGTPAMDVNCCCSEPCNCTVLVPACRCLSADYGTPSIFPDVQIDFNLTAQADGLYIASSASCIDFTGTYILPGSDRGVQNPLNCAVSYYRYADRRFGSAGATLDYYQYLYFSASSGSGISGSNTSTDLTTIVKSGVTRLAKGTADLDTGWIQDDLVTRPRGSPVDQTMLENWNGDGSLAELFTGWKYQNILPCSTVCNTPKTFRSCSTVSLTLGAPTEDTSWSGCRYHSGSITATEI